MRSLAVLLALTLPGLAFAEGQGVTVVNGTGETLRKIYISPVGSASYGENRLRSSLPARAQARIGYSTGCRADVRLTFDSGRTEEFLDQDACSDLRVTAGHGVTTTSVSPPAPAPADAKRGKAAQKPNTFVPVTVEVPPWTGRSITKKFGGLD
jgi:hypothetical protein